jgi:uncharacterized protein YggE
MADFGVADEDVKTTDYTVSPQYAQTTVIAVPVAMGAISYPRPTSSKITGYQVTETVEVTVRDTAKAGDVLSKLGTLGVQNISGPNFMVDDDNGVMNEARAEAIENAQSKAKELAKELGVSLGDVVSYSDQGGVFPMYSKASVGMDAAAGSVPNLAVGTDERTVTVQVTYRIK